MGRSARRKFVQNNKQMNSICPICMKKSILCTNKELDVVCALCGKKVFEKKAQEQCFMITNKKDAKVGEDIV